MASCEKEEEFENILSSVLLNLEERGLRFSLKKEQEKAIKDLYFGRDVVGILPTGFGKSLIFQLLVLVQSEQFRRKGFPNAKATVLVICPLRSLIDDQLAEVRDFGIEASSLPEAQLEEVKTTKWQLIYSSPECALEKTFLQSLKEGQFHDNMVAVVIDESHTIETWTGRRKSGTSGKGMKVFRKAFGELAMLRSFCKEGTPFLALTGTADKGTIDLIQKDLLLKNANTIFVSPERTNLRFTIKQVKEAEMFEQLDWLITMVRDNGDNCPKTLIFCNTLNDIAKVFNHVMLHLGPSAYSPPGTRSADCCIIGMYHSNSFQDQKNRLLHQLKGQGKKRVVVASSALSMGVNFPDIRYVINWGPARNLLDQLQEAGRAGRDGNSSDVFIVYHGKQLSHCNKDVKLFVKADGCYRVAAYKNFDESVQPALLKHDCCNYCRKSCLCNNGEDCQASFNFDGNSLEAKQFQSQLVRPVTVQDKQVLKDALCELVSDIGHGKAAVFDKVATHGFSEELIEDIVSECHSIFTVSDITSRFPVYSMIHAHKILEVLNEIFMDIPEEYLQDTTSCNNDPTPMVGNFFDCFENISFTDSESEHDE